MSRLHFASCILNYGVRTDGPSLLHQTHRRLRHHRRARELRQSGHAVHPLRPGRGHHSRPGDLEAVGLSALPVGMRPGRARHGRGRGRRPRRQGRRGADSRREEARRRRRSSRQPRRTLRAGAGGDSGHLSPRSDYAAAQAIRESRRRHVRRDLLGRCAGGDGREAGRTRGRRQSARARIPGAPRRQPPRPADRAVPREVRRARPGQLRAVRRRGAAARERAQLRARAAADARSREHALPPELRRRFPRYLECAGGAQPRLRRDAPGTAGDSRLVRAGRGADVADRRQRGRMGAGTAGDRGRPRARIGQRHHRRQAPSRVGGRPRGVADLGLEREPPVARRRRDDHRCEGGARRAPGAGVRGTRPVGRGRRRSSARAHQRTVHGAGGQRAECARRQRGTARRDLLHAADHASGARRSLIRTAPAVRRRCAGAARRRNESRVHGTPRLDIPRDAGKGPVHRQLRQLPRRDEHPGGPDPAGSLVPRIVVRRAA